LLSQDDGIKSQEHLSPSCYLKTTISSLKSTWVHLLKILVMVSRWDVLISRLKIRLRT